VVSRHLALLMRPSSQRRNRCIEYTRQVRLPARHENYKMTEMPLIDGRGILWYEESSYGVEWRGRFNIPVEPGEEFP